MFVLRRAQHERLLNSVAHYPVRPEPVEGRTAAIPQCLRRGRMHCPSCGSGNPEEARFCIECGVPLQNRCASCGFENLPRAKFCAACGTPLTVQPPVLKPQSLTPNPQPPVNYTPPHLAQRILAEQAALEARGAPDGERKTITALFADIKDSPRSSKTSIPRKPAASSIRCSR